MKSRRAFTLIELLVVIAIIGILIILLLPAVKKVREQGHAEIKDGQFDTRSSQKGAVVGPVIVRIVGGDGVAPGPFTPFGNLLFDEYTITVDLSRDSSTLTFDVPATRPTRPGR